MKIRKNQTALSASEWDDFVCAFKEIREGFLKGVDKPSMDDFADEHALAFGKKMHEWQAHSHDHDGIVDRGDMFLAWHRVFLSEFENRLRKQKSGITIPYWNAFKEPFPEQLKKISDNEGERVNLGVDQLPNFAISDFFGFQLNLEDPYHNEVHKQLGGTVAGAHAPRDAAFWLHHAFVDRQWGHWYEKHDGTEPPNMGSSILGDEIVKGKKVRDVLHTTQLDYVYDNGIFGTINRKGSESFSSTLEMGMILCVKLDADWYAKMIVSALSGVTAVLTMQQFPFLTPSAKKGLFPSQTMYINLKTAELNVAESEAHIRVIKKTQGSSATYTIEAVNGTQLAEYTGISDFTANSGAGGTDYEMLTI